MKVLLINGSPHVNGCTFTALEEVASALGEQGIETEIFHIGNKPVAGCMACGRCGELKKCVVDDTVNELLAKAKEADGFVFGSPVYYAGMNGSLASFMDRAFYAGSAEGVFKFKPAAAVVNARRGGNTATFDQINKYFTISQMPVIASKYWNMTHGLTPEQVKQDEEGMQTMRVLGRNMAWILKCIEAGAEKGITIPEQETPVATNFVR